MSPDPFFDVHRDVQALLIGRSCGSDARYRSAVESSTGTEVTHLDHPGNLTALGVEITEWNEHPVYISCCFRSLTPRLQHVDVARAYRFLHTVTGHLNQVDAFAHLHMDANAHDDTISPMQTLFDAVVTVDETGSIETQTR